MMSGTSSKGSRTPLKLLSEVLREKLTPEQWSEILGDDWRPPSARSSSGRTS